MRIQETCFALTLAWLPQLALATAGRSQEAPERVAAAKAAIDGRRPAAGAPGLSGAVGIGDEISLVCGFGGPAGSGCL